MKKLVLPIVILLLFLAIVPLTVVQAKSKFKDLDEKQYSWALESINFMTTKGILTGYPDGTFQPQNPVTKAEFTAMLYRLFDTFRPNLISDKPIKSFTDVPESFWAYQEIMGIYDENFSGSAFGYEPEASTPSFQPELQLTRFQLAQIIQTAFAKDFVNHDLDEAAICKAITLLKDIPHSDNNQVNCQLSSAQANSLSAATIASMQLNGILTADANGNFRPLDEISRAEVVTVLYRVLGNLNSNGKQSAYSTIDSTFKFAPPNIPSSSGNTGSADLFDSNGMITKDLKNNGEIEAVQTSGHKSMTINLKSALKVDLKVEYNGKSGFLHQEELPFTLPLDGIEEVKLKTQIRTSDKNQIFDQTAVLSVVFK
jgi:hypothetical protein